jgi:predicted permease
MFSLTDSIQEFFCLLEIGEITPLLPVDSDKTVLYNALLKLNTWNGSQYPGNLNLRQAVSVIWNTVLPTFIIIGAGVLYGCLTSGKTSQIGNFILYLAAPCLIITSLMGRSLPLQEMGLLIATGILYIFMPALLGLVVLDRKKEQSVFLPVMFPNTGNLGLPLALFAWGEAGMSKAVIIYVTTSILLWTLGIRISAGKDGWKEAFKLPLVYAVMVPIVMGNLGYSLPGPLLKAVDMIGSTTIPLLLFVLGVFLSNTRGVSLRKTSKGALLRIGVGLATGYAIVMVFGLTGLTRDIILLYSLMPSAVMTTVIADRYGKEPELVSAIIFTSTLLSLILIPIMLSFLG